MSGFPWRPMEPVLASAPFNSPRHVFQVKWDGVRCLARVEGQAVGLFNRRLKERTRHYPELLSLPRLLDGRKAVLDGEVIALRDGRPSFPLVLQRDLLGDPSRSPTLASRIPITYMVFDLLALDGKELFRLPLARRLELLKEVLQPQEPVFLVDSLLQEGQALFQAVTEQGLEGIVAKELESPYLPGVKSPHWLKIKCWREGFFTVGGYTLCSGKPSALLLGAKTRAGLTYVGKAGSGLGRKEWLFWQPALEALVLERSPFAGGSPCPRGLEIRWARPEKMALVRFLDWTEDLKLRAPTVLGPAPAGAGPIRLDL